MRAVVGFLLMSLQVAHVKSSCDGRENGAQCFGVLGGAVDVQLMDNVPEIPNFKWIINNSVILYWKNNTLVTVNDDRIHFFPINGTVRINDLRRTDSGEYKLDMFDRDGKDTGRRTLQLFVKAPVSSVQLSHDCLSEGQMKVSCVSEGDSPQYSWTLDGHTLTDSELFSRDTETNIIVLRQNISGHLVCSVRNQVSNSSEEMNLAGCGYIFINCTSNGTQIAKWVYKENNTLCVEPTTVPPTTTYPSGAPVSSVQLVPECLSQGQMKVSCVSQGDSPQYSWTLDGHTLTDSELFSRDTETNIIVLRQNISGHLVCSVRNQVSNSSEEMNLTGCDPSSWLTLRLRTIAAVLPLIALCLYFTWKQKKYEKTKSSAIPPTEENLENSILMVQLSSARHHDCDL